MSNDLDAMIDYTLKQLDGEEKTMALKEIPATKEGEQLLFQSIELGEVVRELKAKNLKKRKSMRITTDESRRLKSACINWRRK